MEKHETSSPLARPGRRARTRTPGIAAALCALLAAGAAQAATLYSPPVVTGDFGTTLFCQLRNVGPTPISVTIDDLGFGSEVMNSFSKTLAPDDGTSSSVVSGYATSCRFTVTGSAKNVRAVAVYWDGSKYTAALPAH